MYTGLEGVEEDSLDKRKKEVAEVLEEGYILLEELQVIAMEGEDMKASTNVCNS